MKYLKTLSILALGLIAVACGNPAQKSSEAEFIDSVTEALAIQDLPASWSNNRWYRIMEDGSNNWFRIKCSVLSAL